MSAEEMQEEIQFLMTDINRYIRRAEEHDREARRIRGHDRGYAMHLRKRAAWYRGKASYALDELKCLKEQLEAN